MLRRGRDRDFAAENFVGALRIKRGVVFLGQLGTTDRRLQFLRRERTHAGTRRAEHGGGERRRRAIFIEDGDERFADAQPGQQLLGIVEGRFRIILSDEMNRLAIVRGEGAQSVLHLHPELAEDIVRDISRQLGAEKNADPFGADQFDDGLDFIEERLLGVRKNQVRFVDKENELWAYPCRPLPEEWHRARRAVGA